MSILQMAVITGSGAAQTYVDDVFSAYTYTGNGATQTITNGIDLAGKGGLVWGKGRSSGAAYNHRLQDTSNGVGQYLSSNTTAANTAESTGVTAFNSNGFTLGSSPLLNQNNETFISWTFRKAAKFFDVVTYTGNGTTQTISHSLGSSVGCILIKRTSGSSDWLVFHRSLTSGYYTILNMSNAEADGGTNIWGNNSVVVNPTATHFTVGSNGNVNSGGESYVAYLFAHDTGTDGIIQCGSYTGDGSASKPITLGWETQYLLVKESSHAGSSWLVYDTMRGFDTANTDRILFPNGADAEYTDNGQLNATPTATGFTVGFTVGAGDPINKSGHTYIYMAIRRPNKPPTSGTQVYNAIAYTGSGVASNQITGTGFPPDVLLGSPRGTTGVKDWFDRLRGFNAFIDSTSINAENGASTNSPVVSLDQNGATLATGSGANRFDLNSNGTTYVNHFFRRAPGVFDEVCYTGTGANATQSHSLAVAPELWIVKGRSGATSWRVGCTALANTDYLVLDSTAASATDATSWNSTYPTSSVLSLGTQANVNTSSATYVAYLFATKAGISKVGSYTGNGSNQTINCGFTTGARYVLIKRTDSTGDWFVWDSVRGIVAGNDPHLSLNTTAAEVTTDDSVDTDTSGFIVNQDAATNINVNAATYIYLALS